MEGRSDARVRGKIGHYNLKIQRSASRRSYVATHSFITRSYLRPGAKGGIASSKTSGHAQPR